MNMTTHSMGRASVQIDDTEALMRIAGTLAKLGSAHLATVIEAGLAILDQRAGDPDLEPNGDEEDGVYAEDEDVAAFARIKDGPGCLVSDSYNHEQDGE